MSEWETGVNHLLQLCICCVFIWQQLKQTQQQRRSMKHKPGDKNMKNNIQRDGWD